MDVSFVAFGVHSYLVDFASVNGAISFYDYPHSGGTFYDKIYNMMERADRIIFNTAGLRIEEIDCTPEFYIKYSYFPCITLGEYWMIQTSPEFLAKTTFLE